MRSLALIALLGSFVASTRLAAQSLTEHAAAAAGATIGTAAGKPLGTALGKVFGNVDKTAATAAAPKPKTVVAKPAPVAPPETTVHAVGAPLPGGGGDGGAGAGDSASAHRSIRRRELSVQPEAGFSAPFIPVTAPVVVEPVVKEPTVEEVASIKVGATASELRSTLGAPESRVFQPTIADGDAIAVHATIGRNKSGLSSATSASTRTASADNLRCTRSSSRNAKALANSAPPNIGRCA